MKIHAVIGAASAAIAITAPVAAHDAGDKVTPNFQQAIPNIPGKSLIAVVVDYPPGGLRSRIPTRNRHSSTPTSYREAKLLAVFVVDTDDKELTTPIK
jgi:hypothetical protein